MASAHPIRMPSYIAFSTLRDLLTVAEEAARHSSVVFDLEGVSFVSPVGMAVFAATVESLKDRGVRVAYNPPRNPDVRGYLERMDVFYHLFGDIPQGNRWDQSENLIELNPIHSFDDSEEISRRLRRIFDSKIPVANRWLVDAIDYAIIEAMENVVAHAERPGFICAQTYWRSETIEIGIADYGIGILGSFAKGGRQFPSHRDSILHAVQKETSSKKRNHSGIGLFIIRRIMEQNNGRLTIVSGDACINWYGRKQIDLSGPFWTGTIIGLEFNPATRVDIKSVMTWDDDDTVDEGTIAL